MQPVVEPAESGAQIEAFINLPFRLHKKSPFYVPELRRQTRELLDVQKHPFWRTAIRKLFLASVNGVPVGRLAAIVDFKYNEYAKQDCGAFGFFECINSKRTAHALLEQAAAWLRENGMRFMRGPLSPSTNYSCGMMVQGFDTRPALMMPWNPSWYPSLLESWHLRKEQDLFAYVISKNKMALAPWLLDETRRLKLESPFTCRPSGKKTLAADVRIMLDLYRESWAQNWGFSPLSEEEATLLVKELTAILDPRFFVLFFHEGKPAAGMVALPDMSPLLQALNGKTGLLAPLHWLRSRKEIAKGFRIMLFGIMPRYRRFGLPLLLLDYMLEQARKMPGLEWVEGSWVLEDNTAIDELIEDFGGEIARRYRIYRKELWPCGQA